MLLTHMWGRYVHLDYSCESVCEKWVERDVVHVHSEVSGSLEYHEWDEKWVWSDMSVTCCPGPIVESL